MSIIRIIDAFTFYGLDVVLLAALTCIAVYFLKISIFKRCQKKVITFLPFAVGCVLYALYAALIRLDFCYLVKNYVTVLEHGLSVGALSTVLYVGYEQFVRDKKEQGLTEGIIATLIDGYVPAEASDAIAREIAQAIEKDVTGDGAKKAFEILSRNGCGQQSENDYKLLAKLIIETLAHITA